MLRGKFSKLALSLLVLLSASCVSLMTLGISEMLRNDSDKNIVNNVKKNSKETYQHFFNNTNKNNSNAYESLAGKKSVTAKNSKQLHQNNNVNRSKTFLSREQKAKEIIENLYALPMSAAIVNDGTKSEFVNTLYADNSPMLLLDKEIDKVIDNLFANSISTAQKIDETGNKINKLLTQSSIISPSKERESLADINEKQSARKRANYVFAINKSILPTIPPNGISQNNIIWNNANIKFYYNLNNFHSVGIELGWQDFPQEFTRTIEQNVFEQKQMPVFFYGSALYYYNLAPLFNLELIEPFSQISIGGTSVGPVFGAVLGASLNIYNNFGISLAGNFDMLLYNVENTIYNSDKIGAKFGLFYGF